LLLLFLWVENGGRHTLLTSIPWGTYAARDGIRFNARTYEAREEIRFNALDKYIKIYKKYNSFRVWDNKI
jgi:hypothetical protein